LLVLVVDRHRNSRFSEMVRVGMSQAQTRIG
jgi:hypothetical protein